MKLNSADLRFCQLLAAPVVPPLRKLSVPESDGASATLF
jgi:hypothetical protein